MRLLYVIPFLITSPAFACISSPEDNFKNWDKNNDGVVTFEEYSPPNPDDPSITDPTTKKAFQKIDTDKNEKIDKIEGLKLPSFTKCQSL